MHVGMEKVWKKYGISLLQKCGNPVGMYFLIRLGFYHDIVEMLHSDWQNSNCDVIIEMASHPSFLETVMADQDVLKRFLRKIEENPLI